MDDAKKALQEIRELPEAEPDDRLKLFSICKARGLDPRTLTFGEIERLLAEAADGTE